MDKAPAAFEAWWQALPLRNGEIAADHIRQAWDAAILFERARAKKIADLYVSQARPAGDENVGDCPLTAYFDGQRLVAQNIGYDIENGL